MYLKQGCARDIDNPIEKKYNNTMKRRSFFAVMMGALGLAIADKSDKINIKQNATDLPIKFVHKFRTPQELNELYGNDTSSNLENMRARFFQEGKILSLRKFSKYEKSKNQDMLFVSLIFDSNSSKAEYISQRKNILIAGNSSLSISKS